MTFSPCPWSFPPSALIAAASGVTSYPHHPSSPDSDEGNDLSDLDPLHDDPSASRMRYKQLRSNPPRPHPGPPPQRGMRGRGGMPRGGPRGSRGAPRSFSSESSRHPGALLPATHTVSAPFPTSHLSNDSDAFSSQRKSEIFNREESYQTGNSFDNTLKPLLMLSGLFILSIFLAASGPILAYLCLLIDAFSA